MSVVGKALHKAGGFGGLQVLVCCYLTCDFNPARMQFTLLKMVVGGCRLGQGWTGFSSHSKWFQVLPVVSTDFLLSFWPMASRTVDTKKHKPNKRHICSNTFGSS